MEFRTNHEAFVPLLDLLLGEAGVLQQKIHVLLGQSLAFLVSHDERVDDDETISLRCTRSSCRMTY